MTATPAHDVASAVTVTARDVAGKRLTDLEVDLTASILTVDRGACLPSALPRRMGNSTCVGLAAQVIARSVPGSKVLVVTEGAHSARRMSEDWTRPGACAIAVLPYKHLRLSLPPPTHVLLDTLDTDRDIAALGRKWPGVHITGLRYPRGQTLSSL
jgi:hypothetical protein